MHTLNVILKKNYILRVRSVCVAEMLVIEDLRQTVFRRLAVPKKPCRRRTEIEMQNNQNQQNNQNRNQQNERNGQNKKQSSQSKTQQSAQNKQNDR